MRIRHTSSVIVALIVGLSAGAASADSADRLSAGVAANMVSLTATKGDLAALPLVRSAGREANECYNVARARNPNLGDLGVTELRDLRECIIGVMANLLQQMEILKSLHRNATFEYAAFAETARLLTDTNTPGRAAIAPFQAMLEAARISAIHESERIVLGELQSLAGTIAQDGAPI